MDMQNETEQTKTPSNQTVGTEQIVHNKHCCSCVGKEHTTAFCNSHILGKVQTSSHPKVVQLSCGRKLPIVETEGSQIPSRNIYNLPVVKGVVEDTEVKTLRDGGCSGVVRSDFVRPDQYTETHVCYLIDGTVRSVPSMFELFQVARVHIDSPYYTGMVEASCVDSPVFDLIVGNIPGARAVNDPDPHWHSTKEADTHTETIEMSTEETDTLSNTTETDQEVYAVLTRQQAKALHKPTKPLNVPKQISNTMNAEQLRFAQLADKSLTKLWERTKTQTKLKQLKMMKHGLKRNTHCCFDFTNRQKLTNYTNKWWYQFSCRKKS